MVFKAYYLRLCAFSNQFTRNMDVAREVVQELFVYLWENPTKLKDIKSVQAYVYTSLKFNSIRRFNSLDFRTIPIDSLQEYETIDEFRSELEYAELQVELQSQIDALPPRCRHVFVLSRFEHLTYPEIASRLSISPKTVEVQISKALKLLHRALERYLPAIILFFFK